MLLKSAIGTGMDSSHLIIDSSAFRGILSPISVCSIPKIVEKGRRLYRPEIS